MAAASRGSVVGRIWARPSGRRSGTGGDGGCVVDVAPTAGEGTTTAVGGWTGAETGSAPLGETAGAHQALGRLGAQIAEGTRLDLALATAGAVLTGQRPSATGRTLAVLLTDGLPNGVPLAEDGRVEMTVLRAATALKATGAKLATVGLGVSGDFSPDLLRAIASAPNLSYAAASAQDLRSVFTGLATGVGCP